MRKAPPVLKSTTRAWHTQTESSTSAGAAKAYLWTRRRSFYTGVADQEGEPNTSTFTVLQRWYFFPYKSSKAIHRESMNGPLYTAAFREVFFAISFSALLPWAV